MGKVGKIAHLLELFKQLKGKPLTITDASGKRYRIVFRGIKGRDMIFDRFDTETSDVFPPVFFRIPSLFPFLKK